MTRYWLFPAGLDSKLLTGPQLSSENVHPLRCVYLGVFDSEVAAMAKAKPIALEANPATVAAHNIRVAFDHRQIKRWRLSEQEIDLLIGGETLRIRDSLGEFALRYSKI